MLSIYTAYKKDPVAVATESSRILIDKKCYSRRSTLLDQSLFLFHSTSLRYGISKPWLIRYAPLKLFPSISSGRTSTLFNSRIVYILSGFRPAIFGGHS